MTNPNDAVGTNAAYGGRTSVNAFNDGIGAYSSGVLSGWACSPSSGMTVALGGSGSTRDIAIAEDNAGNKTTINNVSGSPVNVTLGAAPASNSRIDLIVAYVDNPPQGSSSVADNPSACGIIAVQGVASSTPTAPNDSAIRTAITADGASGTTAYYAILASITVTNGTTDIVAGDITAGASAKVNSSNVDFSSVLALSNYSQTEAATGYTWEDGSMIYKKTVYISSLPNTTTGNYPHGITNLSQVIKLEGFMLTSGGGAWPLPQVPNPTSSGITNGIRLSVSASNITIDAGTNRSTSSAYVTLWYTKTS